MFTYSERDMHRMPAPNKTHLPIKPEIMNSGIMEEDAAGRENEADPNLARLPAPALHGTFAKAYALLTRLASKIGWDDLLKCRSQVFVMEEEYRMQKAKEDTQKSSTSLNEDVKDEQQEKEEKPAPEPPAKDSSNTEQKEEESAKEENTEDNTGELADQMDNVDLNADDNDAEGTKPVELHHTPLVRPDQAAEDPSKVSYLAHRFSTLTHLMCCFFFTRVKMLRQAQIHPSVRLILAMASTFHLATSVYVNDGWITSSWCCMKIYVFILFGELRQLITVHSKCHTVRLVLNGNYWVILHSDYGMKMKPEKLMNSAWITSSLLKLG